MSPPQPTIHDHTDNPSSLLSALQAHLPYSIPLYNRIRHPRKTPNASILSTISPSTPADAVPRCWAACYFDRSTRPETEMWIFSPGEMDEHYQRNDKNEDPQFCATCRQSILGLFAHLRTLPLPPALPASVPGSTMASQYLTHLPHPSVLTLGTCHKRIISLLNDHNMVRSDFPGREAELKKYIFRLSDLPSESLLTLPDGLRWGQVRDVDMAMVQSRNEIPRTAKTLLSLPSTSVHEETSGNIVAWAFLGLDGSLTSLHTEDEWRGRGIAKAVSARLFREHSDEMAVDTAGNAWGHADVYLGNEGSEAMCRRLGGRDMWRHFWVRVDLERALQG
ncbi:hypothetical protein M011DRAFT_464802 [Sporormia fimetaria CBS 119925]|uniref:FR47-like domain-containing protein n=1 Tax=Sporormia fimetaria CBS 119925 TaxID=1340428 RepID=A0A6A6VK63_9PLEO|nr:hypothetical protein M011DRAFT_464802 [Sporormia fimetaria CBS 119925]